MTRTYAYSTTVGSKGEKSFITKAIALQATFDAAMVVSRRGTSR